MTKTPKIKQKGGDNSTQTVNLGLDAPKTTELIGAKLDEKERQKVENLHIILLEEARKRDSDGHKIVDICRQIKAIDPNDFQANYYEIATNGTPNEVSDFLVDEIDVEKHAEYLEDVLSYITNPLFPEHIIPIRHLLERASKNKKTAAIAEHYDTVCDDNEKLIKDGTYKEDIPRDVFLAYKSEDVKLAMELCKYLEDNNLKCFLSSRNLRHGRSAKNNYWTSLYKAMDHCKVLVFVSTHLSRTEGDAIGVELPYIKEEDEKRYPQHRGNYFSIPLKFKKPRVEYLPENDYVKGDRLEDYAREFFKGFEYRKSPEAVLIAVNKALKIVPEDMEEDEVKYCKECGAIAKLSTKYCGECGSDHFVNTQKEYLDYKEELLKKSAEEQLAQKLESQQQEIDQEKQRLQEMREELENKKRDTLSDDDINLPLLEDVEIPEGCSKKLKRMYKKAKSGNAKAQYKLGQYYYEKNAFSEEAFEWFYRAAQAGNVDAQYALSIMYWLKSKTVLRIKWLRCAAEKGHSAAQYYLAEYYCEGFGVPQDDAKAVYWYKLAAKQGNVAACKALSSHYSTINNTKESNKWARRPRLLKGLNIFGIIEMVLFCVTEILFDIWIILCNEKIIFPFASGYLWLGCLILLSLSIIFGVVEWGLSLYFIGAKRMVSQVLRWVYTILIIMVVICFSVFSSTFGITKGDIAQDGISYKLENDTLVVQAVEAYLKDINIPEEIQGYKVVKIEKLAFTFCYTESVIIPASVTEIESKAFARCNNLTIYCEAENEPSGWSYGWNYDTRPVVWGYKSD